MREFAKIPACFWVTGTGRKTRGLGTEAQITAFYLLTNSHANMIGVYYLPMALIALETGMSLEGACKGMCSLIEAGFCHYDDFSHYVWVEDMAFDQIGAQLKPNDNRVKAVNQAYAALPELPFLHDFYEKYAAAFFLTTCRQSKALPPSRSEAPFDALRSKEKEKENEKKKKRKDMSSNADFISSEQNPFSSENKKPAALKSQALEILQFMNEKTGKAYRPVATNLNFIIARLKSGASVMDCRQVIAKKTREWKSDPKMMLYLRPATLFNATKFEQYIGELVIPKEGPTYDAK